MQAAKLKAHRTRCHGGIHVKGCRLGRPLCRAQRAASPTRRPCRCEAFHFPHRAGYCAVHGNMPYPLRKELERGERRSA